MKKIILLGIILIFSTSCTAIGSAVMSAIGGLDFIVHTATDKGLVDHAVSEIRGEDCKISNIVKENREICKEIMQAPHILEKTIKRSYELKETAN